MRAAFFGGEASGFLVPFSCPNGFLRGGAGEAFFGFQRMVPPHYFYPVLFQYHASTWRSFSIISVHFSGPI